jgi:hypothetical protein
VNVPLPIGELERLAAAGIQLVLVPGVRTHFVFERDGFAALVERTAYGFGQIGSAGLVTPEGLAVLVWRGEQAFFVRKGFERPASPEEVAELRRFAQDLATALAAARSGAAL